MFLTFIPFLSLIVSSPKGLPPVPHLFVPAVACPSCRYPNDHTFFAKEFCQNSGHARCLLSSPVSASVTFDLSAIDLCINSLQSSSLSPAYSKQKQSLLDATPLDICRFLVFKDSKGKTQGHNTGCLHLGQPVISSCQCPLRLASSTVDSYNFIGKLRSIFSDIGRRGD